MVGSLCAAMLFLVVACGDETQTLPKNDDSAVTDDLVVIPDEDTVVVTDILPVQDDIVADDTVIPDEEPVDETVIPDAEGFETIGDFALDFQGIVNVNLSDYTKIKGGKGTVNFNYRGTPYSFGELTVIIMQLFPIAILQQGNVAVMWLDSAPGLGAAVKKVFGFTFPSTITPGEQQMEAAQAFAFYGDININLQAGLFEIKCVRAAGYQGTLNMIAYDGTNANFTASGLLADPAAAASQLPYPVCLD
jgi:hypothetical protein